MTPISCDTDLEQRWAELHARLDAVGHELTTQGSLESKEDRGKLVWRVRYLEYLSDGRKCRRTIVVGNHPELLRRVQQLLAHYRAQGDWAKETETLAKLALYGGIYFGRGLVTPCKRRRAREIASKQAK